MKDDQPNEKKVYIGKSRQICEEKAIFKNKNYFVGRKKNSHFPRVVGKMYKFWKQHNLERAPVMRL
jgi:hypothetical protein